MTASSHDYDVDELSHKFANEIHFRSRGAHRNISTPTHAPSSPMAKTITRTPTFSFRSKRTKTPAPNPYTTTPKPGDVNLRMKGFVVKGEGNCLPLSIAHHVYNSTDDKTGHRVRQEVVEFIRENINFYLKRFGYNKNELKALLKKWAEPNYWLGESFISAAADCYDTQFTVYGHNEVKPSEPGYYNSNLKGTKHGKPIPRKNAIVYEHGRKHYSPIVVTLGSDSSESASSTGEGEKSPSHESMSSCCSSSFNQFGNSNDSNHGDEEVVVEEVVSSDDDDDDDKHVPADKEQDEQTLFPTTPSNSEASFFGRGIMNVLRRTPSAVQSVPAAVSVSTTAMPVIDESEDRLDANESSVKKRAAVKASKSRDKKEKARHSSQSFVGGVTLELVEKPQPRVSSRSTKGKNSRY